MVGRVGDSPLIGAGTYANDETVAVSCTGYGEKFIQAVVAYDISAQLDYAGVELGDAVEATFARRLDPIGGFGGIIAINSVGDLAIGYNSLAMFRGWIDDGRAITSI
jgi:beta-aspartyl-peptidase (threonine type)